MVKWTNKYGNGKYYDMTYNLPPPVKEILEEENKHYLIIISNLFELCMSIPEFKSTVSRSMTNKHPIAKLFYKTNGMNEFYKEGLDRYGDIYNEFYFSSFETCYYKTNKRGNFDITMKGMKNSMCEFFKNGKERPDTQKRLRKEVFNAMFKEWKWQKNGKFPDTNIKESNIIDYVKNNFEDYFKENKMYYR